MMKDHPKQQKSQLIQSWRWRWKRKARSCDTTPTTILQQQAHPPACFLWVFWMCSGFTTVFSPITNDHMSVCQLQSKSIVFVTEASGISYYEGKIEKSLLRIHWIQYTEWTISWFNKYFVQYDNIFYKYYQLEPLTKKLKSKKPACWCSFSNTLPLPAFLLQRSRLQQKMYSRIGVSEYFEMKGTRHRGIRDFLL